VALVLNSQTAFTAVTPQTVKQHLNVTDFSTDPLIQQYINTAVNYIERRTGMDLRTCTWTLYLDQFPHRHPLWPTYYPGFFEYEWGFPGLGMHHHHHHSLDLFRGPLQSVQSITYNDTATTTKTLTYGTDYTYITPTYLPGRLQPLPWQWPYAYAIPNNVQVAFTSGFLTVPDVVIQAIFLLVGGYWNDREDNAYGPGTVSARTGEAVDCLLGQIWNAQYK
jgi:hypothetical protein